MIKKEILAYFANLKPPKRTSIVVDQDILIISSNTNPYELGLYIVLICFDLYITFASQFWHGFWFGGFFVLMYWMNYKERTILRFTEKDVVIKENLTQTPAYIPLSTIEYVDFRGIMSSKADKNEIACTRIKIKNDKEYGCFFRTPDQKFLYRCLKYYVENYNKEL